VERAARALLQLVFLAAITAVATTTTTTTTTITTTTKAQPQRGVLVLRLQPHLRLQLLIRRVLLLLCHPCRAHVKLKHLSADPQRTLSAPPCPPPRSPAARLHAVDFTHPLDGC
jgi:hypothetical protein